VVGGVVGASPQAGAVVLCSKRRSGVVSARPTACRRREAAVDVVPLLGAGAIGASQLADGAVGTAALADGSVTAAKLASGVVPKFISLNVYGAKLGGDAEPGGGAGPFAGIRLVDGMLGGNHFEAGFTLPPNYTTGTPVVVHVVWHTSATACDIVFSPNSLSIARVGRTHLSSGGSVTDGMEVVGGDLLTAPATANQSNETRVTITSPEPNVPLQAGDAVNFNLHRAGTDAADTCTASMAIQGLWVEYQ